MVEPEQVLALARSVLAACPRRGAMEIYVALQQELEIHVGDGQVQLFKRATDLGAAVRVYREQRMGFAFTACLLPKALRQCAEQALAVLSFADPDPWHALPGPNPSTHDAPNGLAHDVSLSEKVRLCQDVEAVARAADRRVRKTERVIYQEQVLHEIIVNSLGLEVIGQRAHCGVKAYLVAEDGGEAHMGITQRFTTDLATLDPGMIGHEAARRATALLDGRPIPSQRMTVLFDPAVGAAFLNFIAPALSADMVQKGRSLFADLVGEKVASPLVTILDDGCLPGGPATSSVDAEGVPMQKTVLIDGGTLHGFLHTTYTATRSGVVSTGKAARVTFRHLPIVGSTNFYLYPGCLSFQAMLAQTIGGLYIQEVLGMHTANRISGEFSVGAAGQLIENAELGRPVRGVTISGTITEFLQGVNLVGDDLLFFPIGPIGFYGCPTLRIGELAIAGAS